MADSADQFRGQARLPRFAAPCRYELRLRPDLVAFTFSGAAAVAVDFSAPTRFLVLNAADLAIDRASIRFQGLAPAEVSLFTDDEILVLGFDKELPLGEGVLRMDFNSTLNDQLRGFYRSKYEYKGETKYMAVTQFEPVYARRCFPSWDEPAFKAKFKLILEVPSELVALSNMPVANETVAGPIKTVHYEESPLMSTYLVAIVVGLFEYIEGVTSQGTKVRVYTQVGKSNQGKFALDVGVKSWDLYKDYFDTPYPLPKLDMVAIPDFAAGAMENFGLVTFREIALLFDEQSSSASSKESFTSRRRLLGCYSVFSASSDNESKNTLQKYIEEERIVPSMSKDDFWMTGETGPCGPCIGFFFDCSDSQDGVGSVKNITDEKIIEICRLVFVEFNRQANGVLGPLQTKHVLTGINLESLAAILQNKESHYDLDVYADVLSNIYYCAGPGIEDYSGKIGAADTDGVDTAYRLLADHIRMIAVTNAPGSQLASQTVRKIIEINPYMLGTMAGVYHVGPNGWKKLSGDDVGELHYHYYPVQAAPVEQEMTDAPGV